MGKEGGREESREGGREEEGGGREGGRRENVSSSMNIIAGNLGLR